MLKKFNVLLFRRLSLWSFCILLLTAHTACQKRDQVIAGVSIPIPREMNNVPDKSFDPIPGFEDGQASFQGKVAPGEIFTFYQENMAARRWIPDARFVDQKDRIVYTKGNRVVLIRYEENPDGTTILTILVGSLKPTK